MRRRKISALVFVGLLALSSHLWAKEEKHSDPNRSCISAECHVDVTKHKYLHGPLAIGQCMVCHTPVPKSDHKFKLAEQKQSLCNLCHKPVDAGQNLHDPVQKGDCLICHNPHGSHSKAQVRKDWIEKVCIDCHKEKILKHAGEKDFPHAKLLKEKQCVSCHAPHISSHKHLLRDHVDRTCYTCHKELKEKIQKAKYVHGPVKKGDCGACHATHGTKFPNFLSENLTDRFYSTFDMAHFEFCFTCHEHKKALVLEKETIEGTNFRNGKVNLHFLHVNRPYKGRACKACHTTHAGPNKALIAPFVPFGKWKIPITYKATKTGGSCTTGCHKPYAYDRVNPVDNAVDEEKTESE